MEPSPAAIKPARRNRRETEGRLRHAVEALLVEGGFSALTTSAVARRAGVDKMLVYRYFSDLSGLIRAIASAPDFFPSFDDLCGGRSVSEMLALPISERTAIILGNNARLLRERPVVLEMMVWEMVQRNDLTAIMEEARENLGLQIMTDLFADVMDKARLSAIAAVLSAGVTYLVLRQRKIRWYAGVDLHSNGAWLEIETAIRTMTAPLDRDS